MADQYDLAILGSGPGGYVAAIRAAQLGMKVAIVERERLGGICLNWGCIPTKALLRTSEIYHYMTHAGGLRALGRRSPASISPRSWSAAARWRRQLNGGVKGLMKKNKVTVVEGVGHAEGQGRAHGEECADGKATELQAPRTSSSPPARGRANSPSPRRTATASGPIATR